MVKVKVKAKAKAKAKAMANAKAMTDLRWASLEAAVVAGPDSVQMPPLDRGGEPSEAMHQDR